MKIAVLISGSGRTLKNFIELIADDQLRNETAIESEHSCDADVAS